MLKLFDEQTQELTRLNGLLSIFDSYIKTINDDNNHCTSYMRIALKIQLEKLGEFNFKYYKTEFETSKKKIIRIINHKLDPVLNNMVEHKFYSTSNKIYQEKRGQLTKYLDYDYIIEDCRHKDIKIFNKFLVDKYKKDYINRKVDKIESLPSYKVVFVNPSLKTTIDHKKK
ncbi:7342_t:CDS:2 [Cetraspora pellucida]|uniref:7342_t:CDS:1 n=1 Tax=Cetraspora pellucida TaxID=1433469 RepID=A0A9N9I7E3_9GLOM|nr:7342_t:CDS:2 [Cetraspora pellucida]